MRMNETSSSVPQWISPAARDVFQRMVDGSFTIDIDELASALLERCYTSSVPGAHVSQAEQVEPSGLLEDCPEDLEDLEDAGNLTS